MRFRIRNQPRRALANTHRFLTSAFLGFQIELFHEGQAVEMLTSGQRCVLLGLLLIEIAHSSSCMLSQIEASWAARQLGSPSCLDRDGVSINSPDQLDSHLQQLFEPPISAATPRDSAPDGRDSAPDADQVQQLARQLHSLTLIFHSAGPGYTMPSARREMHRARETAPAASGQSEVTSQWETT